MLFTWSHFCTNVTTPIISVRWVNTITSVSQILKLRHGSFDSLIAVHFKLFISIRLQISVLEQCELAKLWFARLACLNFVQTWPFISHSFFWTCDYLFLPKVGSRFPCCWPALCWLLPVSVDSAHAGHSHTGGMELCSLVSSFYCGLCFMGWISSCREGLFFIREKLLVGRRGSWIIAWDGTLKLTRSMSPVQCCSCILNSAVIFFCELFHGERMYLYQCTCTNGRCTWFLSYFAGILFSSGWLQLIAQVVYDLILLEIDLIRTIDSFHDQ